ncbi:MAG: metallophosphoesterase family protein [Candidatus Hodarchaeales archaeon]
MGRIAIISDIHSNLPALTAVLTDIHNSNVNRIYCLGDLVGYYTHPIPVTHLTVAKCDVVIKGNHDNAAALGQIPTHFRPDSLSPLDWTYDNLTVRERRILNNLPNMHSERCGKGDKKLMLIHGGPEFPLDQYIFPEDNSDIDSTFEFMDLIDLDILFLGHTHIPMRKENENGLIICNPGSVGQPRDGNSQASYLIYNINANKIIFKRVDYDPTTTINGVKEHQFSNELADRLLSGE